MPRAPDRRNRRVAAHEANQQALDRRRKAQPFGDDMVDPGRDEAGAARNDDVAHLAKRAQRANRPQRQGGRMLAIKGHPRRGWRQNGVGVKAAGSDRRPAIATLRQHRIAVRNPRTCGHARKQASLARIGNALFRPVDKGLMDVVAGYRRADGIDAGKWSGHNWLSFGRDREPRARNDHGGVNTILKV